MTLIDSLWRAESAKYSFELPGQMRDIDSSIEFRRSWESPDLQLLMGKPVRVLELGVQEGRAALFLAHFVLTHAESHYHGVCDMAVDDTLLEEKLSVVAGNLKKQGRLNWSLWYGETPTALFDNGPGSPAPGELLLKSYDLVYVSILGHPAKVLRNVVVADMLVKQHGFLIVDNYNNEAGWAFSQPVTESVNRWLQSQPAWLYSVRRNSGQLVLYKHANF